MGKITSQVLVESALIEAVESKGTLYLKGKLQTTKPNKNKRIYPADLWSTLHNSDDYKRKIESRLYLGMLEHTADNKLKTEKTAVVLLEQDLVGEDVIGRLEVLKTPMGNVVRTLYESRIGLGVSSRSDGKTAKSGEHEIVQIPGFIFSGYDVVHNPSVFDALPVMSLQESVDHGDDNFFKVVSYRLNESISQDEVLEYLRILDTRFFDKESLSYIDTKNLLEHRVNDLRSVGCPEFFPTKTINESSMANGENTEKSVTPQVLELTVQLTEAKGMIDAHEKTIQSLTESNEKLSSQIAEKSTELGNLQESMKVAMSNEEATILKLRTELQESNANYATLEKRHNAAKQLLESAISKGRKLNESLDTLKPRYNAACALIEEYHEKETSGIQESVKSAVDSVVSSYPTDKQEKVRKLLENCETVEAVNTLTESIQELVPVTNSKPSVVSVPKNPTMLQESANTESSKHVSVLTAAIRNKQLTKLAERGLTV